MHPADRVSPFLSAFKTLLCALLGLVYLQLSPLSASAQALSQLAGAASGIPVLDPLPVNPPAAAWTAPGLTAHFINVGQGDAIYLELPGGENALIDGGPSSSASGPLARFLSDRGVTRIDHVVLTHPHSDHFKGLSYVFSNLTVGSFYDTRMNNTGASTDEVIREKAAAQGVAAYYPAPGDSYTWGDGVQVKVFNGCPGPVASSNGDAINSCSITMKVSYGNSSILFTGDIEGEVEAALVSSFGEQLRSGALKVPHHGSQYSSTAAFLKAVSPSKAFIEVGKNSYGHPTQTALDRLLAGCEVYRTDLAGTMVYSPEALPAADPAVAE